MLTVPGSLRILVATAQVDFRKSHDGLAALVLQVLGEDQISGSLFVFANKRAVRLKLLYMRRRRHGVVAHTAGSRHVPRAEIGRWRSVAAGDLGRGPGHDPVGHRSGRRLASQTVPTAVNHTEKLCGWADAYGSDILLLTARLVRRTISGPICFDGI